MNHSSRSSRLRIAHVLWDGGHGGSQRYVEHLVRSDGWNDAEHIVAFLNDAREMGQALDQIDVPHLSFGLERGWELARARLLVTWCAQRGVDVVHIHCDSPAALLLAPVLRRRHRVVFTEHGDSLTRARRRRTLAMIWRTSGHAVDAIFANSHWTRSQWGELHPHLADRITVMHDFLPTSEDVITSRPVSAVDATRGDRVSRSFGSDVGWSCGAPTVGMLARLAPEKGVDRFIDAAAQIRADRPDVRFAIYGDGPLRDELEHQSEQLGLDDALKFHGFVDTPRTALAQLALTVVPSRTEAFGLTALESLSVGTPVVTFVETGVAEIVRDGVDGCVVAPHGDVEALAEACLELLADPELMHSMGDAGRRRAEQDFDRTSHVRTLEDLYLRIVADERARRPDLVRA